MKKSFVFFWFLVFAPALLFGQGVMSPPQSAFKVVNGVTTPIANATITVCAANTGGYPCSPPLVSATFKDVALTQPLSNPFTADSAGNYQFAIAPGNYTVTQTALGFTGYSYQITASPSSTTAGLADPGANGIVFRNGPNTTRVSGLTDLLALFSGTCNVVSFIRGDGSCIPFTTIFSSPPPLGNVAPNTVQATNAYFGAAGSSGRPWVDVMNYGCVADGVTDDQPCFQAAINAAKAMNSYVSIDSTAFGAIVYIPCGAYGIQNPIVLPHSLSSGKLFGVVGLKGEYQNCVYLQGASFPITPTSIWLINPGSGYASNPTCAVTGGGGSGLTCSAIETAGIVTSVVFSGTPSGFTSMPTISFSGGGGSGAIAFAVGRGMIEWDQTQTNKRVIAQTIEDITLRVPFTPGAMGIYYQVTSANVPVTTSNATNERLERFQLKNVEIVGSNQYTPASVYLQGDCAFCSFDTLSSNPSILVSNYETVGLAADICAQAPAIIGDEACGMNFSTAHGIWAGGTNGGRSPVFQGRANRFDIDGAFCNGLHGSLPNSVCYWFVNSYGGMMTSIINEGLSSQPQIQLLNSYGINFAGWGVGQPTNSGGGLGNGLELVNSSRNTFSHRTSSFSGVTAFNGLEIVNTVTVTGGGTLYTTPPTVTFTSNCGATLPTATATVSGGAVTVVTMTNTGACTGTPTVGFTGGGGSGATATANMTGLGTLFAAKLDSNSHNNSFSDFAQTGTADISFSDLATNFAETCDATNTNCATFFAIGTFPEYPTLCGTTSTCAGTRNKGRVIAGSVPLVSGTPSTATVTGLTPAFSSSSSFFCTASNATTQANPLKVVNASASSITITGPNTVTDVANYICSGN